MHRVALMESLMQSIDTYTISAFSDAEICEEFNVIDMHNKIPEFFREFVKRNISTEIIAFSNSIKLGEGTISGYKGNSIEDLDGFYPVELINKMYENRNRLIENKFYSV